MPLLPRRSSDLVVVVARDKTQARVARPTEEGGVWMRVFTHPPNHPPPYYASSLVTGVGGNGDRRWWAVRRAEFGRVDGACGFGMAWVGSNYNAPQQRESRPSVSWVASSGIWTAVGGSATARWRVTDRHKARAGPWHALCITTRRCPKTAPLVCFSCFRLSTGQLGGVFCFKRHATCTLYRTSFVRNVANHCWALGGLSR